MEVHELINKWKLNKGVLASKMNMPLGTFCNKLSPSHDSSFSPKELICLKTVLKELSGEIDGVTATDFNEALKTLVV